jgi:hypothetical protein
MTTPDTSGVAGKLGALLTPFADRLWNYIEPKLEQVITHTIDSTLETWGPKIGRIIDEHMAEWLPKIIKAIIVATTQAVRHIAVDSGDKLTDLIPGQMDDAVFDPLIKNISDILGKIGL